MSAIQYGTDVPPFQLGETLKGTDADGNLINSEWIGRTYTFKSYDYTSGQGGQPNKVRTGRGVTCVAVRNTSGITLYGKRCGVFSTTAGYAGVEAVTGYATTLASSVAGVIDEYIATSGVASNDIFWLVVAGPVLVLTPEAGAAFSGDIAVGAPLIAATAASSQTTVAGRVSNVTLAAQTAATNSVSQSLYFVGRALSARTTGETNSGLLINAGVVFF